MLDTDVIELFELVVRCKLGGKGDDGISGNGSIMTRPAKSDTRFWVERRLDRVELGVEGVIGRGEPGREDQGVVVIIHLRSDTTGVTFSIDSGSSVNFGTGGLSLNGLVEMGGVKFIEDGVVTLKVGEVHPSGVAEMLLESMGDLSKSSALRCTVCASGEQGAESPPLSRQSNPLPDLYMSLY